MTERNSQPLLFRGFGPRLVTATCDGGAIDDVTWRIQDGLVVIDERVR